jgi:Leucine-rich repeat (LRR) protein
MSLCYNRLRTLNEWSFNGLDNLNELNLSGNLLREFDVSLLSKMPKLKRLKLSNRLKNDLMKTQLHNLNIDIVFFQDN